MRSWSARTKRFKDKLKDLYFHCLGEGDSSIQKCLDKIRQLEAKQNENGFIHSSLNEIIEDYHLAIPFSMLARHGFIASSIMDSLAAEILIIMTSAFHASIETIATKLFVDMDSKWYWKRKKNFWEYGHLSLVLMTSFLQIRIIGKNLPCKKQSDHREQFSLLIWGKRKRSSVAWKDILILWSMIKYLRRAIEGREYGKFIFPDQLVPFLKVLQIGGQS